MSEEEEEQKGKKSPAFFEARLPTIVGAGSRNWRGSPLLFSAPTDDRNARRAPVGRPFECPRALLQRGQRGHLRSTGTFGASDDVSMPFPFKGSLFSTALSPSKEEEENLVSRRRGPINLSSFYSPSRAPGSTRPRASRPRRRMRVRLWSRRAPGFVNQGVNGRGEREKRREEKRVRRRSFQAHQNSATPLVDVDDERRKTSASFFFLRLHLFLFLLFLTSR